MREYRFESPSLGTGGNSSDKDTAPSAEEMKVVPNELGAVGSDTIVSVLCATLGHLVTFVFLEEN
jgi:hypothetical protein